MWWETDQTGITKKECVKKNAKFYFVYDASHECFPHFWIVHKRFWHEHHQPYSDRMQALEGNTIYPPDNFKEIGASLYKYEPDMALSGVPGSVPAAKRAFVSDMAKEKKAKKNHHALRVKAESELIRWGFTQPQNVAEIEEHELVHVFALGEKGQGRVNWICDSEPELVKLRNLRDSLVVHNSIFRGKFETMEVYLDWVKTNMLGCTTGGSAPSPWVMSKARADGLPQYPPDPMDPAKPFFKY